MYQVILFDLDGTLTDSKEGILNCLHYAFEKMGKAAPDDSVFIKFIGPPLQDSFMEYTHFTEEEAREGIRLFRERYSTLGKFENAAAPGMPELCARLREKGYTLALASSKPEEMCRPICEKFGYTKSLHAIVGSPPAGEGDWEKEDVVREALRRLHISQEDKSKVLMVGDRKFDAEGAGKCGIDCVGVEFFGYAEPGELKKAGAIAVVQTPEELEQFILQH